ncbi:hypothetical protein N7456_012462 [Penicillium angulare]|uniref:Uncharacterized protein n=1 Tax=Penicillium angulare TaxID=116970 RepID=A0A9W9K156_9EURO|nr:hypothetical protein N7456_012462 [Penicillium angulare]
MEPVPTPSKARRFNERTLKKLQAAFELDPEVDLVTKLPTDYSNRLDGWRSQKITVPETTARKRPDEADIRLSLDASVPIETIYPLSQSVLDLVENLSQSSGSTSDTFSERLVEMIQASQILYTGPSARCKMAFKCNSSIVLKAVRNMTDFTEYTTLQYLRQHLPNIPIPEPLGLLRLDPVVLIFMSYQPGSTLTNV